MEEVFLRSFAAAGFSNDITRGFNHARLKPEIVALALRLAEVRNLSVDKAFRQALERDLQIHVHEETPDALAILRADLLGKVVDRLSRGPVRETPSGRGIIDDIGPS